MSAYLQQQLKERQWDYDLVSLAADARVTLDCNLVGLQVPRTSEAASSLWEPNDVYKEIQAITDRVLAIATADYLPVRRSSGPTLRDPLGKVGVRPVP